MNVLNACLSGSNITADQSLLIDSPTTAYQVFHSFESQLS